MERIMRAISDEEGRGTALQRNVATADICHSTTIRPASTMHLRPARR
jgi:hypothetical protein